MHTHIKEKIGNFRRVGRGGGRSKAQREGGGGGEWVKLNYRGSILHSDLVVQNNKLLLLINLVDLS